MAKKKSASYYEIINIPDQEQFLIIYNHVIDGMYFLEKLFKKNYKLRNFDISEMWQCKYENYIVIFDSTKKARKLSDSLQIDIRKVFEYAHRNWIQKHESREGILDLRFLSSGGKDFSLHLNDRNKIAWYESGSPCYPRTDIFNLDNILDNVDFDDK